MKAFRYYLLDDKGNLLPPMVGSKVDNSKGKYGNIPLINTNETSDLSGAFNTAEHNGTSVIIAPDKKHSIYNIGQQINQMLSYIVAAEHDKHAKERFDYANKLYNNMYDWNELKDFFESYKGAFGGDTGRTLKYLDSGYGSPLYNVIKQTVDNNIGYNNLDTSATRGKRYDAKHDLRNITRASYVNDTSNDDTEKSYTQLMGALGATHDALAHHYGPDKVALYQVEFDPDDIFTGKDYLENKETAQVDFPAEGKVKVNKVYPGARIDYNKLMSKKEEARKAAHSAEELNNNFRGLLEPVMYTKPEEIASDERLKVLKHHNDWVNTQRMIPNIQRGIR